MAKTTASTIFSILNSTPRGAGEGLALLAATPTPAARDDFYEAISIESLATIPANTKALSRWGNIVVIEGQGAMLAFTKMQFGKKNSVKSFQNACAAISNNLVQNYCQDSPGEAEAHNPSRITTDALANFTCAIEAKTGAITLLTTSSTKVRVLLMPATGCAKYTGSVYIQTLPQKNGSSEQRTGYTLVLPQSIIGATEKDLLEIAAAEIAVCLGDCILKAEPSGWMELGREMFHEWEQDENARIIPSIEILERGRGRACETRLKRLSRIYKPIAAHILAHQYGELESALPSVDAFIAAIRR